MIEKKIAYIIGIYTIIQVIILLGFGYTPYPDSQGYITCAQESLSHGQFYPAKEELYTLPFLWNIGAINIVALSLKCFHSIMPVLVFYTILKSGILLFTYLIALKCLNKKVANLSIIIAVFYLANYGEATSLLSEIPFMFFILFGIYASINKKYIVGGILLGCADYFRPIAIIFILAYIISNIRNYKAYFKLCLAYSMIICCIGLGNYMAKGQFIYKAKTGWMALAQYHWNCETPHQGVEPMSITANKRLTYSEKDEIWKEMFFDWLIDHKMEYIKQIPIKVYKTYISDNVNMCAFLNKKEKKSQYMYDRLSMVSLLKAFPYYNFAQWLTLYNLIYYYMLMGIFLLSYRQTRKVLPLTWNILALGTLFIAIAGHGEARFHIPFMPFIIINVAYFINKKYMNHLEKMPLKQRGISKCLQFKT